MYRICSIKRPGVYYLKSSPERRAFIREGRLFESGRLFERDVYLRVGVYCFALYTCAWLVSVMAAGSSILTVDSVIRGHHIYKVIWTPTLHQTQEAEAIDLFFATSTAFSL